MQIKEITRRITAVIKKGGIVANPETGLLGQLTQTVERGPVKYWRCVDADGNSTFGPFLELEGKPLADPLSEQQTATVKAAFPEAFPVADEGETAIRQLITKELIEAAKERKRTVTIGTDGKVRVGKKEAKKPN